MTIQPKIIEVYDWEETCAHLAHGTKFTIALMMEKILGYMYRLVGEGDCDGRRVEIDGRS